ncbi:hypothetical protein J21TS7_59180 [Paenibacillus cineris]|uniref:DUF4352 domain-containing protein n=1 Tax=Paenibacillus cineris TaxID=237530 RepID=A0ABQ4LMU7_9BACL|nr:hypothetical protein J21TS7_59180 [Paenibacillus cineris]
MFFYYDLSGSQLFDLNPDSQGSGLNSPKAGQFSLVIAIPYLKLMVKFKYECEPTEGAHVELQEIKF